MTMSRAPAGAAATAHGTNGTRVETFTSRTPRAAAQPVINRFSPVGCCRFTVRDGVKSLVARGTVPTPPRNAGPSRLRDILGFLNEDFREIFA
jgi:hypothetical protein